MLKRRDPILYIFSGLPGVGKSTMARQLADRVRAAYLRIDTIEQALRDLCAFEVRGEGYRLSSRIAADNLRLGISVVADSCNPIELTRNEWEGIAGETGARHVNIEVICSDKAEHRIRAETRPSDIAGLKLPKWQDIEAREYHPWTRERIVIDTTAKSATRSFNDLLLQLSSRQFVDE